MRKARPRWLIAFFSASLGMSASQRGQTAFLVGDSAPSGRFYGLGGELYADGELIQKDGRFLDFDLGG